jgi:hypothetical protein
MWAVGVLAYVLLSGLSPFAGADDIETLKNVKACRWQFDDEAFSGVSEVPISRASISRRKSFL